MTEDDVIARLVAACDKAGGQSAWAKANEVSQQYVQDVIKRRRSPGPGILKALGLERVTTYRRVR
jgi:L-lactate utilization protein LutB